MDQGQQPSSGEGVFAHQTVSADHGDAGPPTSWPIPSACKSMNSRWG